MRLLTLLEAAEQLRVSVRSIEREAADGRLAIVRIRSRRMVDPAELDRYVADSQVRACQSASEATATRSASASAAVAALSEHFRLAQRSPTPARSRSRLAARASTLRLVADRDT
jgi:excisionase family DNA binding protein